MDEVMAHLHHRIVFHASFNPEIISNFAFAIPSREPRSCICASPIFVMTAYVGFARFDKKFNFSK